MFRHSTRRRPSAGFTLIEIMVVIAIIGLIMTIVGRNVMTQMGQASITTTEAKITQLKDDINLYRLAHKSVPDSLHLLLEPDQKNLGEAWISGSESLNDAWGNEFIYSKTGSRKYEIRSLGADGIEGGEGEDADISSDPSMPGG
jgi:general secretion pathway protein G